MSIRSYQDLEVWQKAIRLAIECYQLAKRFPADERYGLVTQLQRATVSVASTSRKDMNGEGRGSSCTISQSREDLSERWAPASNSPDGWITRLRINLRRRAN